MNTGIRSRQVTDRSYLLRVWRQLKAGVTLRLLKVLRQPVELCEYHLTVSQPH